MDTGLHWDDTLYHWYSSDRDAGMSMSQGYQPPSRLLDPGGKFSSHFVLFRHWPIYTLWTISNGRRYIMVAQAQLSSLKSVNHPQTKAVWVLTRTPNWAYCVLQLYTSYLLMQHAKNAALTLESAVCKLKHFRFHKTNKLHNLIEILKNRWRI